MITNLPLGTFQTISLYLDDESLFRLLLSSRSTFHNFVRAGPIQLPPPPSLLTRLATTDDFEEIVGRWDSDATTLVDEGHSAASTPRTRRVSSPAPLPVASLEKFEREVSLGIQTAETQVELPEVYSENEVLRFWISRFDVVHKVWKAAIDRPDLDKSIDVQRVEGVPCPNSFYPFFWQSLCVICYLRTCKRCGSKLPPPERDSTHCPNCAKESEGSEVKLFAAEGQQRSKLIPLVECLHGFDSPLDRIGSLSLLFSTSRDGFSFKKFNRHLSMAPSLIVIHPMKSQPFGCVLSMDAHSFCLSEEFSISLFTLHGEPRIWKPSRVARSQYTFARDWIRIDERVGFSIGGEFGSSAISLSSTLTNGTSWPSSQFSNKSALTPEPHFEVQCVEVWVPFWVRDPTRAPERVAARVLRSTPSMEGRGAELFLRRLASHNLKADRTSLSLLLGTRTKPTLHSVQ